MASAESSIPPGPRTEFRFENATDVRIASHAIDYDEHIVKFWVEWRETPNSARHTSKYNESHVQDVMPEMVYTYWAALGGLCTVTKLCMYHVHRILDEQANRFLVQWVGYDDSDTTWESKTKVKRICPAAVLEWNRFKKNNAM